MFGGAFDELFRYFTDGRAWKISIGGRVEKFGAYVVALVRGDLFNFVPSLLKL